MPSKYLDEDGYPTLDAINYIKNYPYHKSYIDLMDFIKSLWHQQWWGWDADEPIMESYISYDKVNVKRTIFKYRVSTAGWSGNEALVKAMMENPMFWSSCWLSSRRGGHYEFEIEELEDLERV